MAVDRRPTLQQLLPLLEDLGFSHALIDDDRGNIHQLTHPSGCEFFFRDRPLGVMVFRHEFAMTRFHLNAWGIATPAEFDALLAAVGAPLDP